MDTIEPGGNEGIIVTPWLSMHTDPVVPEAVVVIVVEGT